MSVAELIELLKTLDPNERVLIQGPPHEGWVEPVGTKVVDSPKGVLIETEPFAEKPEE